MKAYATIAVIMMLSFCLLFNACSLSWTEAIQRGNTISGDFRTSLEVDMKAGILIIPVEIGGKTYRFLFDSAALLTVSPEIRSSLGLKTLSEGYIVDSSGSRNKLDYVDVPLISIGGIEFSDQTAMVADLDLHPVLQCYDLDGIIGTNLMRLCDWTIDYKGKTITLSRGYDLIQPGRDYAEVLFYTDRQFNIRVDLNLGIGKVSNLKLDYGSNGSITIPQGILDVLKDENIVDTVFVESGIIRSGLFGDHVPVSRELSFVDTIYNGEFGSGLTAIKTGNSALIGTGILKNYVVSIDWERQRLLFNKHEEYNKEDTRSFGFKAGLNRNDEMEVQSVILGSEAELNAVLPGMLIKQIDGVYFDRESSICRYIEQDNSSKDSIEIILYDNEREIRKKLFNRPLLKSLP